MGLLYKAQFNSGFGAPATTSETVVFTTPILQIGSGVPFVHIVCTVNYTPGTGTTLSAWRLRQGSLITSPAIPFAYQPSTPAASVYQLSFSWTDISGYLQGGAVYSLTAQQTGATGNGQINILDIGVIV